MKAVIVVDMQNDFVSPKGALYVPGADGIVKAVDEEADRYPLKVLTKCWHPHNDPSFNTCGGPHPVHCLRNSWGAWLVPRMMCQNEADLILHKVGYSAFFARPDEPTGLHGYLRDNWVDELRIVGVALDYCVKETAHDAARLGYGVSISLRATRPVDPAVTQGVLEALHKEGVGLVE